MADNHGMQAPFLVILDTFFRGANSWDLLGILSVNLLISELSIYLLSGI